MSGAHHYRSNLQDILFNLFDCLEIDKTTLTSSRFESVDKGVAEEVLTALEELSTNEFAGSFVESDKFETTLSPEGDVTIAPAIKASLEAYYDNGWHHLELPTHLGGLGAPPSLRWAAFEFIVGANPCLAFYLFGTFIGTIVDRLGTESQKKRFMKGLTETHWGGSMVLTEPDAGSDVGAGRTRARHIEDDLWELEGTKRFITNGDFDLPENIVHLVLARPEGADIGTKGLSLFLVPKYWVNEDGSLGERNGVFVTGVEKKMGLKGSTTCDLTMGEKAPCRGLLVGNSHDGIRQIFHVIEHARMAVGVKSTSTLSTAYLNALDYTRERVQGPDLKHAADKTSPRIPIIGHPDVRRMLMLQKCHAEGLRALFLYTASVQDQVEIQGGHTAPEAQASARRNDLLLPLLKGYSSERVYELLGTSLQCFGGSGYVQDYPMEQYIRDQKIDSLYEGTTHIQALDLIFRKSLRDGGETLQSLLGDIGKTVGLLVKDEALTNEARQLGAALEDVMAILGGVQQKLGESVYHVGLHGNRVLFALAEVVIGWLLIKQSAVAHAQIGDAEGSRHDFLAGKIAAVRFYCAEVLPAIGTSRKIIEQSTLDLMELQESAF